MDFKEVLKSKPHNPHYLNRYIKFIENISKRICISDYIEEHHICPKASDLFPEYEDKISYPDNIIQLSAREHIIAHLLLWKTYGKSQLDAVHYMLNVQNSGTRYNSRVIHSSVLTRYAASVKEQHYINRKGKSTYKDNQGNKYYLNKNDPLIVKLGLIGNNAGNTHSEEAKNRMSSSKEVYKKVTLYSNSDKVKVLINSNEYLSLIDKGYSTDKTNYIKFTKEQTNKKVSQKLKGKCNFHYPDGTYYGRLPVDSPLVKELGLKYIPSENQINQCRERAKLAVIANTNSEYWNNGVECRKFKQDEDILEGWVKGLLIDQKVKDSKNAGISAKNSNVKYWNNGKVCIKLPVGQTPDEGWVAGMLPRNKFI